MDDPFKFAIEENPEGSWADIAHMIYLDQPVNTGFSYSDQQNEYLDHMDDITAEFLIFMKNLYTLYPDLQARDLYLTGEAYAGKFVPVFANAILEANEAGSAI